VGVEIVYFPLDTALLQAARARRLPSWPTAVAWPWARRWVRSSCSPAARRRRAHGRALSRGWWPMARLQSQAERITTPCGAGHMVWHAWGSGRPLVLLHGGSGSWTHWLRNIEPLVAVGRRVIAADLPGFGDSAVPATGSDADALPEPLQAGLAHIVGDAAVDVAGFSFGGMTAGLWAQRFPARVARLVVVGAPGLGLFAQRPVDLSPWRHLDDEAQRDAVHRANLAALMLGSHRHAAAKQVAVAVHVVHAAHGRTSTWLRKVATG
jgi:2-hydroxy-6-oxonona-2,4-dienedioate hydrolase